MVRIPQPQQPGQPVGSVTTDRAATPGINVRPADLSAPSRDLQAFGGALSNLAVEVQSRTNDAAMREAEVAYMGFERQILDPQNGLFARRQGNAMGVTQEVEAQFSEFKSQIMNDYGGRVSNSGRQALEQYLNGAEQRMWKRAASHELTETQRHEESLMGAQIEGQIDRASFLYNDGAEVAAAELQIENLAGDLADARGLTGVARDQFVEGQRSAMYAQVATQMAADSPTAALEYVKQMRDQGRMDPTDANGMMAELQGAAVEEQGRAAANAIAYGDPLPPFAANDLVPGLAEIDYGAIGTRDDPLQPHVVQNINRVVRALGPNIDVQVTSAGQPPAGQAAPGERTGSQRHDHGNAADIVLKRDGKVVTPSQAPELYEKFFEMAAPHFPGMGHYDWGIHVGGGSEAFWGPDTRSASADPTFAAAARRGRERGAGPATLADIQDPQVQAVAAAELERIQKAEYTRNNRQKSQLKDELFTRIDEAVANGNTNFDLEVLLNQPGVRRALGDDIKSVRDYYTSGAEPATDWDYYRDLQVASETNPDQFATGDIDRSRLDPTVYKAFVDKQADLLGEAQEQGSANRVTITQIRNNVGGILTGREPEERGYIERRMEQFVQSYTELNNGTPPSAMEQYAQAERLAAEFTNGPSIIAEYDDPYRSPSDLSDILQEADEGGLDTLINDTDLAFNVPTGAGQTAEIRITPDEMRNFAANYEIRVGRPPRPSQVIQMLYLIKSGLMP